MTQHVQALASRLKARSFSDRFVRAKSAEYHRGLARKTLRRGVGDPIMKIARKLLRVGVTRSDIRLNGKPS